MNTPELPFDRVTEIKPMDEFGVLVTASLVLGILRDFTAQLIGIIDEPTLDAQVKEFIQARHLDFPDADPRFWEAMLTGVEEVRRQLPEPILRVIPATNRSVLTKLEDTLPPYKEGRDRQVQFENDGTIVYPECTGQWAEEPREINGYQRDPTDAFRFLPLWRECLLRHGIAVRYAACGCVEVIMRCNNPAATEFGTRLTWEQCRDCTTCKEPTNGM